MTEEFQAGTGQPTSGSGGLAVPLGVHFQEVITLRREFEDERARRLEADVAHAREVSDLHRSADQVAIAKALEAQKEMAEKHNDLIRAAEKKDETYATKMELGRLESWQSKLSGGMVVLGAIGVANLVKLWTG